MCRCICLKYQRGEGQDHIDGYARRERSPVTHDLPRDAGLLGHQPLIHEEHTNKDEPDNEGYQRVYVGPLVGDATPGKTDKRDCCARYDDRISTVAKAVR